ncbi:unnamed protein product [Prorocentrum cordatum]|uniref:Uncharacterized protein n=1 Tax=Prorocentrum cordatum TaxID=2364126 RepID=A0ABN9T638_9DINO|nr:unnamed protein product [Polarella glacialis]
MQSVRHAGRSLRLIGVAGYNSAKGGDKVFQELEALRPGVVLMESFAAEGVEVVPGGAVPYHGLLPRRGVSLAQARVAEANFRSALTAEAVAVLSAMRVGAEVRLGDRLLTASFDRLVRRTSLGDLCGALAAAAEAAAAELRGLTGAAVGRFPTCRRTFSAPSSQNWEWNDTR